LGWSQGRLRRPWYYEPEGLCSSVASAGLLTTCGLEHALFMAEDTAEHYHYPPIESETSACMGAVSNRPAPAGRRRERWEGDECVLWAASILQARVRVSHLLLRRHGSRRRWESCLRSTTRLRT
jgi:hypothetical protein